MDPSRFQFGLKVVFAVMTNIALVLGGWPVWTLGGLSTVLAATLQLLFLAVLAIWVWCGLDQVTVELPDNEGSQ